MDGFVWEDVVFDGVADVGNADGVETVQWGGRAIWMPPVRGKGCELCHFLRVDVVLGSGVGRCAEAADVFDKRTERSSVHCQ